MENHYVLIGAGSAMFTRGLLADLIARGEACQLALVDPDPQALEVAERLAAKMIAARQAPIALRAATDRRQVLPGATVIICTVGVGGRRAWEQDVLIPRQFGIYQPVGDSVMPGGTSRALRMIPAMVAIAQDMLDLAPTALFFNYSNPMAPICRAVRKATGAPIIGLCHGVFRVAGLLTQALGVTRERMRYTAVGMNHLAWFTEVRIDGADAMPRLMDVARQRLAELEAGSRPPWEIFPFAWYLTLLMGAFPASMDRHITEFFPALFATGSYYGHTLGVDAFSFEETIAHGDAIYAEMRAQALAAGPLDEGYFARIGGEHEQVLDIVASIQRDQARVFSVNLPNCGQVPNLQSEAILESPGVADGAGVRAIALPPLSPGVVGTLATRLAWVEIVVEAALEGSRNKFIQALILDGAVTSVAQAEQLADALLKAQAAYLPQFTE